MIGDVLVSSVLCNHLKQHFPDSEVHYLVNDGTQAVLTNNPGIDSVLVLQKEAQRFGVPFLRVLQDIRATQYNSVIDVYGKLGSMLISFCSGATYKITFQKKYNSFVYTHFFPVAKGGESSLGLVLEDRLQLLLPHIAKEELQEVHPQVFISPQEIEEAKHVLTKNQITKEKPLIMIGIMGSTASKSYPLPYLAQLIDVLTETIDGHFIFNYMPHQQEHLATLLAHCSTRSKTKITESLATPSLRSFLGVLNECTAYIGNEGGATNMAKALGVPNFSIFSPRIPKNAWFTFRNDSKNRAVHLADYVPELNELSKKEKKKQIQKLYYRFKPELLLPELRSFVKEEILSN